MSLSKWLQHDHGQHNRSHLSPLLQLESQDEDRDDSTTTITSARSASGLRRSSMVRLYCWEGCCYSVGLIRVRASSPSDVKTPYHLFMLNIIGMPGILLLGLPVPCQTHAGSVTIRCALLRPPPLALFRT